MILESTTASLTCPPPQPQQPPWRPPNTFHLAAQVTIRQKLYRSRFLKIFWSIPSAANSPQEMGKIQTNAMHRGYQGCIFRLTCSYPELTEDHVLTSAYVKIFKTVTRNAVNKSVWRKKDCFWLPLNKHAMNIWLSSLSAPKLENRKTSPYSPRAPNLLHVLLSQIVG